MGTTRVSDPATVGGVVISNANKVWWPDEGITKGDVARFYHGISSLILPWMRDRPLTAERCPDGMLGGCFYRKNFPEGNIPADAPRLRLRAESTGKDVNYLVGGSLDALLGLVRYGGDKAERARLGRDGGAVPPPGVRVGGWGGRRRGPERGGGRGRGARPGRVCGEALRGRSPGS